MGGTGYFGRVGRVAAFVAGALALTVTTASAVSVQQQGVDTQLSALGGAGDVVDSAEHPALAYNPHRDEYLVVWSGDTDDGGRVADEYEIFARRINAASGSPIGKVQRISSMGVNGDPNADAVDPAAVYNTKTRQYLVVWSGNDTGVNNEDEIWGQRLSGDGRQIGINDFRMTHMGPEGEDRTGAEAPAVAYNPTTNQFLLVFHGDHEAHVIHNNEVYEQRHTATGALYGHRQRISKMGDTADSSEATNASVAYNAKTNQFLVAWMGHDKDNSAGLEIYTQRLSKLGLQIGGNDVRISSMGPDGNTDWWAMRPDVSCAAAHNRCLVAWMGADNRGTAKKDEFEIFSQMLNGRGEQIGVNDEQVTKTGSNGDHSIAALPKVAYSAKAGEFLVGYIAMDNSIGEIEAFGRRVQRSGTTVGARARFSDMGPEDDDAYQVQWVDVVSRSKGATFYAAWQGEDNANGFVNDEQEIFGQSLFLG